MALINRTSSRTFHRKLFAPMLEKVTLLKRDNDQRQGTVTALILFQCWRGQIFKKGQTIQNDMVVEHTTTWHLPRTELERVGVAFLNSLDRIVDGKARYWQPESSTEIRVKLFETHVDLDCLRIDPPAGS